MKVKIKLLHPDAKVPERKHELDAGFDLYSVEDKRIRLHEVVLVDCGFAMEIPPGYEAQIRPRSGMATNKKITIINSPATIDAGYRGPIKVPLICHNHESQYIKSGDRIAQMIIQKLPDVEMEVVDELSDTERGTNGFGSTYR